MSDELNLKPCPFCVGEAELRDPHGAFSRLAAVFCNECGIRGPLEHRADEAIAAWNTRNGSQDADVVAHAREVFRSYDLDDFARWSDKGIADFLAALGLPPAPEREMVERPDEGSMRFLLQMVEADIERDSDTASFLVRAGLLRDILKYALSSIGGGRPPSVSEDS